MKSFCYVCGLLVGIVCFRILYLLVKINRNSGNIFKRKSKSAKMMIVAGSGGHTAEMMKLVKVVGAHYAPRLYVLADTDSMSEHKIIEIEKSKKRISMLNGEFSLIRIPRSREVKQSYLTSIFSTLYACLSCFPTVFSNKPDLVLCNGPGTCIPICAAAFLLKVLMIKDPVIVFVESICRVESLSLSGRMLYLFADYILVQWEQLLTYYPRCQFIGRLV